MYRVTLNHLDAKTLCPASDLGLREFGKLSDPDLLALLARFCEIDPTENARVEPEIRVEIRGDRYIFQTGTGKLHRYNVRDRHAPATVLTPAEALADFNRPPPPPTPRPAPSEPDVSRQEVSATVALPGGADDLVYVPPPPPPPSRRVPILIGTLALLLVAQAALWFTTADSAAETAPVSPLPGAEAAAARRAVVGVFMAAGAPRPHGIALTDDGAVKLFRVNPVAAPSVVRDTFRPGRRETKLVLVVERLGTVIEVSDANTLVYGGETFRRLP